MRGRRKAAAVCYLGDRLMSLCRVAEKPVRQRQTLLPDPMGDCAIVPSEEAVEVARRQAHMPRNGGDLEIFIAEVFGDESFCAQPSYGRQSSRAIQVMLQRKKCLA